MIVVVILKEEAVKFMGGVEDMQVNLLDKEWCEGDRIK
jgi:hypothetical protein